MPRVALTPAVAGPDGLALAPAAANADGHSFTPQRGRALLVENTSAGAVTLTIPTPGTVDGLAVADRAVVVAAGTSELIGLGEGRAYVHADGVHVDYSVTAGVAVQLVDVP